MTHTVCLIQYESYSITQTVWLIQFTLLNTQVYIQFPWLQPWKKYCNLLQSKIYHYQRCGQGDRTKWWTKLEGGLLPNLDIWNRKVPSCIDRPGDTFNAAVGPVTITTKRRPRSFLDQLAASVMPIHINAVRSKLDAINVRLLSVLVFVFFVDQSTKLGKCWIGKSS